MILLATGEKSLLATKGDIPVADNYFNFQSINKYATEGEITTFQKGHKINIGRKHPKEFGERVTNPVLEVRGITQTWAHEVEYRKVIKWIKQSIEAKNIS